MSEIKDQKKDGADITFFHPDLLEVPADGTAPFLKGYRCQGCGQLDFPKLSLCPRCWGDGFDIVPLSRRGRLYSVTDNYTGQAGMRTPYTFGYVDLPEGLRIFAQMEGKVGSFVCDEEVELVVGPIRDNRDGQPIISYKFKKVKSLSGGAE